MSSELLKTEEQKIKNLISSDSNNWTELYLLMDNVEKNELYIDEYKSFSTWVHHISQEYQLHPSGIWAKYQAGKIYTAYYERAKNENRVVNDISHANISVNNLVLIEKIYPDNNVAKDDLIEKAQRKEIRQATLKKMWESIKKNNSDNGNYLPRNAYEKEKCRSSGYSSNDKGISHTQALFLAISSIYDGNYLDSSINKYKLLNKVHIDCNIKFDFVAFENTQDSKKPLIITAYLDILSVSLSLLALYKIYCDKLYIVAPKEMKIESIINDISDEDIGIITVDSLGDKVIKREAIYRRGEKREAILESAILKLI